MESKEQNSFESERNAATEELIKIYEEKLWDLQEVLGYSIFEEEEYEKIIKLKELCEK